MIELPRHLLDSLNCCILWFDAQFRLQYVNLAGENLFGVSRKQLFELELHRLFPGEDALIQGIYQAMGEGHTISGYQTRLCLYSHKTAALAYTATPVEAPDSGRNSLPCLLLELHEVEHQLRFNREEYLQSQHQAALNVIRGLAHEIKNPLGGLRGAAQLLERELPTPDLKEYTDIIIGEADRLQNLLNRLLGPRDLPEKTKMNIHVVLCRVNSLIASEHGDKIKIHLDFDPSLPDIFADSHQLHQVFLNIMRNAVQAMDGKGDIYLRTRVQRHVVIGGKRRRLAVCIEIRDNGPGIPEEMQEQIFYPLVTSRSGGTGLGLSIAQTLVQRNDGLLGCQSEPGNTVFMIHLPIRGN